MDYYFSSFFVYKSAMISCMSLDFPTWNWTICLFIKQMFFGFIYTTLEAVVLTTSKSHRFHCFSSFLVYMKSGRVCIFFTLKNWRICFCINQKFRFTYSSHLSCWSNHILFSQMIVSQAFVYVCVSGKYVVLM